MRAGDPSGNYLSRNSSAITEKIAIDARSRQSCMKSNKPGSKEAKDALNDALQDKDKPVVDSAIVALSNIEFMETIGTNEKFAKLTGG